MKHNEKLFIDWETADRITVATLIDCYKYMKESLDGNEYLHPGDRAVYLKTTECISYLVKEYFGASIP